MEQIKVTIKKEDEEKYQFDVRMGEIRTRPTVECNEQAAMQIHKQLCFVNENPELFNVNEPLVFKDFSTRIYGLYGINIEVGDKFIDFTIGETVKILNLLHKKRSVERKSPVKDILNTAKIIFDIFIRLLLLGQFGTGKSTIIKKLSGIHDDVDFPVVDTARTTIHDAHYIFKDRNKYKAFRFSIDFKSSQEIYRLVSECYIRATDRIFAGILENKAKTEIQDKAMIDFVSDPDKIFKIEYIFGKYYNSNNPKRDQAEKNEQVRFWDEIYQSIYKLIVGFMEKEVYGFKDGEENTAPIEKDLRDKFLKDRLYSGKIDDLVWQVVDLLESKIRGICEQLEAEGKGGIVFDGKEVVGFKNDNYDIDKIEEYVTLFSSTNIINFTKIITPLVQSIAIEVPYNNNLSEKLKQQVICVTDTVGFEHRKTDDTGSLEGSTQYSYNNYDVIGIIDSSKQSMNGTTENLLREVYNNADKSKVMLMYTFFDEFTKKDFEDSTDKEYFLMDLQNTTLRKIDDTDKVENFIVMLEKRTRFLQGLMTNDPNCMAGLLGSIREHFENLYNYKKLEIINVKKPLMAFNYRRLALVFNKAQEDYIKQQKYLYLHNYPGYKTTEALTGRLKNGHTCFSGTNRSLKPIDDFSAILMEKVERFIRIPDGINFKIKSAIPNHEEKVIDWFKEEVSSAVKYIVKKIFVDVRTESWNKLYIDGGAGVDYRRRIGIIQEINEILPELVIDKTTFADRWIQEIESIFERVLEDMTEVVLNFESE
ncbi:hypothetical protein C0Q44_07505 [Paenibacillus sp. PCH8]|uniref:hypothetical protein n=1 Tax=Paenibacillus sp. PCH8 TaxID=2066524 RepID=UPI000CF88077|nr:hypothetical protein [Paenibacillus sp. PCH8]PQP84406.1 hypothetical protein C0Q44_07505 [Paenibacillus sp. PCH8]